MTEHLRRNIGLTSFLLLLISSTVVFAGQTQKGSDIQFYGFLRMDPANVLHAGIATDDADDADLYKPSY